MELIESKTLASAAAFIEFTSIPQTFTDLLVFVSIRTSNTNVPYNNQLILFNGSSANFSARRMFGGGNNDIFNGTSTNNVGLIPSNTATSNTFGNVSIYIANYTSNSNKSYYVESAMENNATFSYTELIGGLWSNSAAINSLRITGEISSDIMAGSTVSLYGIVKGSDGIVTTSP